MKTMADTLSLNEINELQSLEFTKLFHNIVECYPDVGKKLESLRPFDNVESVIEEAQIIISNLDTEEQTKILHLHPDLAGKLADEDKLTSESKREQAAAGLTNISNEDKAFLNDLNQRYREKFCFPFVICARENKFNAILHGIQHRLLNSETDELHTGIEEVKKICRFRILELIKH